MPTSDAVNTANPAQARVQLLSAPIASPGQCAICGKNKHEKGFADARLDFEFYGTLYFCGDCVGDFARLFGYLGPEEAVKLAVRIQQLESDVEIHRAALLNLESAVEHLTNYRMLRSVADDADSNVSESGFTDEGTEKIPQTISGTIIPLPDRDSETQSDTNELTSEQRSTNIPESTSSNSDSDTVPIIGV